MSLLSGHAGHGRRGKRYPGYSVLQVGRARPAEELPLRDEDERPPHAPVQQPSVNSSVCASDLRAGETGTVSAVMLSSQAAMYVKASVDHARPRAEHAAPDDHVSAFAAGVDQALARHEVVYFMWTSPAAGLVRVNHVDVEDRHGGQAAAAVQHLPRFVRRARRVTIRDHPLRDEVGVDVQAPDLPREIEELRRRNPPAFRAARPYWIPTLSSGRRAKPLSSRPNV